MAKKKVIVMQDGAHGPADVGDTIDHKLLPLSAEVGNALQAKDDGLFVATGGTPTIVGKTLRSVEAVPYPSGFDADYEQVGEYYKYTFEAANGEQTVEYIPKTYPMVVKPRATGGKDIGLISNTLNLSVAKESGGTVNQSTYLQLKLPTAKLETPVLTGSLLKLGLAFHQGGVNEQKIANSTQGVSVDIAPLLTAVPDPSDNTHAANKKYVDDRVEAALSNLSSPAPQTKPLILVGRAQYATCKLAPFDGGGNAASKIKDVVKSNTTGETMTFSNELSFQTTKAGWYRIKLIYQNNQSSGLFLNNGVAKFLETTAPLFAEDSFPTTGYLEFLAKVDANKVYRTNLADKTSRSATITNVHFTVEYVGD